MKTVMALSSQTRFRRTHTKTKTGCDTCKRRRVKCDETRPFCLKCVSTGRTCHGYHPPRPWIFDPEAPKSGESRRLVPLASSDSLESIADTVHTDSSTHRTVAEDVFQHGLASTSIYLDWSAAYREPLITSFLSKFLSSRSTTSTASLSSHNFTGWPNIACKLAGVPRHEFLTTALMSASLCILSFEEQDPRLWSGAVSIYQQSLPRLRRAISRLSQCHSDSLRKAVIAACFVLGLEEFMMSSSVSADAHMEGIETIVRHGGPEVLEDDGVRRLFYDHQPIWLCICTTRKQLPTYAKPEWLEAVKKYGDGVSQTIFQTLWPKITQLLSHFVEYDQVKENASIQDLWQFATKLKKNAKSLDEWRADERLPETSKSSNLFRGTEEARKRWNAEIEEKGLEVATILAYHSAFSVHLCLTKLDIGDRLRQKGVDAEELIEDVKSGLYEHVGLLMETLPFPLRSEHGLEGAVHMPFVMESCWKAYTTLEDLSPDALAFFNDIGGKMKRRGFQSLTEPWLDFTSDGSPATFSTPEESP